MSIYTAIDYRCDKIIKKCAEMYWENGMFLESTTLWREFPPKLKANQLTLKCQLGINWPIDREHLSVAITAG
jgi:hypothetical protein